MEFTYDAYEKLILKLRKQDYCFVGYQDWEKYKRTVILRHDIDFDLSAAVRMAELERKCLGNEKNATYFLLLSTNFYNVFSKESRNLIKKIIQCGGEIGLHFDETQYHINSPEELKQKIIYEKHCLENIIERTVEVVSMHRPSVNFLASEVKMNKIINAYAKEYFVDMKYVSDSRRNWREDIDHIIESKLYERLCILTHPIWYDDIERKDIRQAVFEQLISAIKDKHFSLKENISDFESIIKDEEINAFFAFVKKGIYE